MKKIYLLITLFFSISTIVVAEQNTQKEKIEIDFGATKYFYRWSKNYQYEFTPQGQEDLNKWADMLTINYYPPITDGEGLAVVANKVLENYKNAGGQIVRTLSVPKTESRPAEHLIEVIFIHANPVEISQAHLRFNDGVGLSIIHSHRFYNLENNKEISQWVSDKMKETSLLLMTLKKFPSLKEFENVIIKSDKSI